jgi:hypothetical protein
MSTALDPSKGMPTSSSCLKKPIDCEDLSVTCFILSTGAIVTKGRVYAYACESRAVSCISKKKTKQTSTDQCGLYRRESSKNTGSQCHDYSGEDLMRHNDRENGRKKQIKRRYYGEIVLSRDQGQEVKPHHQDPKSPSIGFLEHIVARQGGVK